MEKSELSRFLRFKLQLLSSENAAFVTVLVTTITCYGPKFCVCFSPCIESCLMPIRCPVLFCSRRSCTSTAHILSLYISGPYKGRLVAQDKLQEDYGIGLEIQSKYGLGKTYREELRCQRAPSQREYSSRSGRCLPIRKITENATYRYRRLLGESEIAICHY